MIIFLTQTLSMVVIIERRFPFRGEGSVCGAQDRHRKAPKRLRVSTAPSAPSSLCWHRPSTFRTWPCLLPKPDTGSARSKSLPEGTRTAWQSRGRDRLGRLKRAPTPLLRPAKRTPYRLHSDRPPRCYYRFRATRSTRLLVLSIVVYQ